ncbi:DUF4145 domain-containing protein [Mesorhizobium sp. RSR565B]|uniref:DUF4145 domain-containing protein n=1 Tax=Mesorhizobium sp. L103C565B0 TaxID=1287094 RepID=UPI0003D05D14|nr:DUF4145 domain-containing protein [Mesorhizobium sp. L103C565B0]ESZ51000.1 hypothetical protein X730_13525 [Mesorhizobium sp. L103C565B0]
MANLPSSPPQEAVVSGLRNPGVLADYKPEFNGKKFKCPRCSVVAAQIWTGVFKKNAKKTINGYVAMDAMITDLGLSTCDACSAKCLWFEGQLVYPSQAIAHQVPEDLPAEVRKDFEEAAAIASASPRAAAALLRMCIEGLCKTVAGKDTFEDAIVELERQGIPTPVTVAMDVVRLTGNEALHGGRLYGSDDAKTVSTLFRLASLIVSWAITERKELQELVLNIGPEKFAAIEERRRKAAEKATKGK